jgi:ATP/maltotriose-dependent transcriptional regulator MalT
MSDIPQSDSGSPLVRNILMVVAVVFVIGSVIFMVQAQNRLTDMENRQKAALNEMAKKMDDNNGQLRAEIKVLAGNVGITQKDLTKKASALQSEENATQARLKNYQEETQQQLGAVNNEVNGVKGQVTKVSADVTDTRNDLAATKGKLETAIGDLNKHSELIAMNRDQLEVLKHRGDRDYVEFTLHKGKDPTRLSTVSLQLKKVDPKKSQFTLYVMADDKKIEKKDRNVYEPLQFYTGRERNLFEIVVNAVDKDAVSGYMSTPKNMAATTAPDPRGTQQ